MIYVVTFIAGGIGGAAALFIWYIQKVSKLREEKASLQDWANRLNKHSADLESHSANLDAGKKQLDAAAAAQAARKVQYEELLRENGHLKRDLFNFAIHLRKNERDHAALNGGQLQLNQKANLLATKYLRDTVTWVSNNITTSNFASCKKRLLDVIAACRGIDFEISPEQEQTLVHELQTAYEDAVRKEFAREEQARIRAQIREEEKVAREAAKRIQDAQREQAIIKAALEQALRLTQNEHSAEVEALKSQLQEAEEKAQRAISQAQLTKAGNVYVISNLGSFGENVFKIGMTRRLEPYDRVRELGDASVPFPFDVHMMIACEDAPSMENALHRAFNKHRLNKVNIRKEFFHIDFESIRKIVEENHGAVEYVAEPAALQYHESKNMSAEDFAFVEQTMESVMDDEEEQEGVFVNE